MSVDGILKEADSRMDKSVEHLELELLSIRTGRANPALIERVQIPYYGTPTPLNQLAQISAPEARLLVVQVYDRGQMGIVEGCSYPGPNRSHWISRRAQMVFGSYRRDDFADPENFLLQLGMVLERYSDKVIETVTSPLSGIQRECKFPPSIAEFVEFCDEIQRRSTFTARWDAQAEKQLAERGRFEQEAGEPLEHRTAVVNRVLGELKGQHGFQFKSLGSVAASIASSS